MLFAISDWQILHWRIWSTTFVCIQMADRRARVVTWYIGQGVPKKDWSWTSLILVRMFLDTLIPKEARFLVTLFSRLVFSFRSSNCVIAFTGTSLGELTFKIRNISRNLRNKLEFLSAIPSLAILTKPVANLSQSRSVDKQSTIGKTISSFFETEVELLCFIREKWKPELANLLRQTWIESCVK